MAATKRVAHAVGAARTEPRAAGAAAKATGQRPKVGIVGAGAMGMAIAKNLHGRGYRVWVRDVLPQVEAHARSVGLQVSASAQALAAEVDIVVVVVLNAQQIEDVLFGKGGVVPATPRAARAGAGAAPGANDAPAQAKASTRAKTVMLCSTIAPDDTIDFAERLAMHGIATIDAPISGGPGRAEAGTMSMMIAAPAKVAAPWAALLRDLAEKRFVISETVGDGAKAKLVNNLLAGINLVAGAEALALSTKIGLDAQAMFEIIRVSSGQSWIFEDRMARALTEDYLPPKAAAHILAKDMTLATALALSVEHQTPLGDAALARFRETVARGWAELDDAAVIKTYQGQ